jgi:hypothetical protein
MRWLLLFGFSIVWFTSTRRRSGYRGVLTYLAHLSIFLLGWQFGQWIGILIISIPLLLASYVAMYYLAMAIIPAADPDAPFLSVQEYGRLFKALYPLLEQIFKSNPIELYRKDIAALAKKFASAVTTIGGEKWKRFLVFVWYLWGIQYPHLVIADTFGRRIEERIHGTPFGSGAPGLIWCKSNQVVGLTTGPSFGRIAGPGVVFSERFERAVQIADSSNQRSGSDLELVGCVDLRTQFRSIPFEAVSKDGHSFCAALFASFAIDRQEEWPRAEYHRLQRANAILKDGRVCDQGTGSYRYNAARVQAALSTVAINSSTSPADANTVHWDTWALNRLCEGARQVLAQRNLDELWRPRSDGPGKNALDEIGSEIKALMAPKLQVFGIQLNAARVVNYEIPKDHPVVKQQVATWKAAWEKRATEMLADGQAEAERLELEAKAYARCMFLTMVADGLEKARAVDSNLPKHVIAMRIIGAMEELLKQQPGIASQESSDRLSEIKRTIVPLA